MEGSALGQPQSPDSRIYKGAAAVAVPTNESLVLLVDDKLLRLKRSYAPRSRVHHWLVPCCISLGVPWPCLCSEPIHRAQGLVGGWTEIMFSCTP